MSDEYTNILTNVVLPFDPRRTKLLLGTLEYIAAEVIVAKVVRKIMRADNKGWLQLAYVHALSMPFLGGAAGFFDPQEQYTGTDSKGKKIGCATQLWEGAKGIPAVILAQYIVESFAKGFHAPWFTLRDLVIMASAKAMSRPLLGTVFSYLPQNMAESLAVLNLMVQKQQGASMLNQG